MPAAGRPDSKYVRKMHYRKWPVDRNKRVETRCGKHVLFEHATRAPYAVTCRTCLVILDIPPGELDGCN